MTRQRALFKNTIFIGIGRIVSQFALFVLLPIYTAHLTPSEYGQYDLLLAISALIVPLITIQLEEAVFRFLIDARKDKAQKQEVITNVLVLISAALSVFSLLFIALLLTLAIPYGALFLLYIIVSVLFYICLQIARGLGNNKVFAKAYVLSSVISVVLSATLLIVYDKGIQGILFASIIAYLCSILYLLFSQKLYTYINLNKIDQSLQKELLGYSVPLVPLTISWWVNNLADRLIISTLIGYTANGIYAAANKYAALFNTLSGVVGMSWAESASLHINDKDRDEYFSNIYNTAFIALGSLSIVLISICPFLFQVLINGNFSEAYYYIPILILSGLASAVANMYGSIYIAKKQTKQIAINTIAISIMNVVVTLLLVNQIGIYAAAISSLFAYVTLGVFRHYDTKKYVRVTYDNSKLILVLVANVFVLVVYLYNQPSTNILSAVVSVSIAILINKKLIVGIRHNRVRLDEHENHTFNIEVGPKVSDIISMSSIVNNITTSKATCYFISPHFDDAAYSAGALISKLSKTNNVIVINVFTSSSPYANTYMAKRYLKQWDYSDVKELYHDREIEDLAALGPVTDRIINLGFTDAPWRQKTSALYRRISHISPELSAIYSTARLLIRPGKISRADNKNVNAIKDKLLETVNVDNSVIFCPLALGKHIDHVIVRKVCDEIFPESIHWSDYPYNLQHIVDESDKPLREYKFSANLQVKEELVKKYISQYKYVIGDKPIDHLEEYFYLASDAAGTTHV